MGEVESRLRGSGSGGESGTSFGSDGSTWIQFRIATEPIHHNDSRPVHDVADPPYTTALAIVPSVASLRGQ